MATLRMINALSVTLLVAIVSVIPGMFLGSKAPAVFAPSLQQIFIGAWLTGLVSWWLARAMASNEPRKGKNGKSDRAVGLTVAALLVATVVVVGMHFFGDALLDRI
ncbi:MAG: hypothetical protein ACYTGR_16620 [Planctomycetota bacterium]